jgi:hypothetical protein
MHEKTKQVLTGVAALAAAGGITAGIAGAAKDSRGTRAAPADGRGGPYERRAPETALTGEAKDKAEAAALAAVPGGKVLRSEEDGHGVAKYEVHMTDADGAPVDVYLDADFAVTEKRAGRPGGPHGGPGHPPDATPLTGDAKDKAEAAAKAAVANGTVRESFAAGDFAPEGAKYVVLVARDNARPVVVLLDAEFKVIRKLSGPPRRGRHGFCHDGPRPGDPGASYPGPHAAETTTS